MEFCEDHPKIMSSLARVEEKVIAIDKRINGSIDDIHDHIKSGANWRMAIVSMIGVFIIQLLTLAYMWGQLCRTVAVNTARITAIEDLHPRINK